MVVGSWCEVESKEIFFLIIALVREMTPGDIWMPGAWIVLLCSRERFPVHGLNPNGPPISSQIIMGNNVPPETP